MRISLITADTRADALGAQEYPSIELVQAAPRPGGTPAEVLNEALRRATGQIVGWVKKGERFEPGAIAQVMRHFAGHPGCNVLYGRVAVGAEGAESQECPTEGWDFNRLQLVPICSAPAIFFRTDFLSEIGLLDERLSYAFEYELWLRAGAVTTFHYDSGQILARKSFPSTRSPESQLEEDEEALAALCHHATSPDPLYRKLTELAQARANIDRSPLQYGFEAPERSRRAFGSWVFVYAERYRIPLDPKRLQSIMAEAWT